MVALQFPQSSQQEKFLANVEAEELVLGGCLFDSKAIAKVLKTLSAHHFYVSSHQEIFGVILELYHEGLSIDLLIVQDRLEEKGLLEKVGGLSRLAQLIERTVSAANIDSYAEIIIKYWEKRQLRDIALETLELLNNSDDSPKDLQDRIIQQTKALKTEGTRSPLALGIERAKQILLDEGLSDLEMKVQLENLRQELNINSYNWKKDYILPLEKQLNLDETIDLKKELEILNKVNKVTLDLYKIFDPQLTNPLLTLARWLNLRPETYLTALLCGVSGVHSPQTRLILNQDWDFSVTANLFGGIVAPSSQKKSPVIRSIITKPLRELQRRAKEQYERDLIDYQKLLDRYEELKKDKNKDLLKEEFPDGKPSEPKLKLYYFTNATTEGIVKQVKAHPDQGLLYLKDELAGVFKSMNQYRKGSDQEDYLSFYDATGTTNLRSDDNSKSDVDGVLLSIFGSIQPKVLQKLLGNGDDENGQWARFIFVNQPMSASVMSSDGGSFNINPLLVDLYDRISQFAPNTYRLSHEAFKVYCEAYNKYERLRCSLDTSEPMSHVWGKAEGLVGKLALNLHCIEYALKGEVPPAIVERHTIDNAIELAEFYAAQVEAIYSQHEKELPANLVKVLEVIDRTGTNSVSARDIHQSLSTSKKKDISCEDIRNWFKKLVELGEGVIEGVGRQVRFSRKIEKPAYTAYNAHKEKSEQLLSTPEPENSKKENVGNVGNVVSFSKQGFRVGDIIKFNYNGQEKQGELIGFSDDGRLIVHVKGEKIYYVPERFEN